MPRKHELGSPGNPVIGIAPPPGQEFKVVGDWPHGEPMDTAPTDGTIIILRNNASQEAEARWYRTRQYGPADDGAGMVWKEHGFWKLIDGRPVPFEPVGWRAR